MPIIDSDLFPPGLRSMATEIFGTSPLAATLLRQPAKYHIPQVVSDEMAELSSLLHPNELAKGLTFTLKKRQNEYLSGRLCGKLALESFWKVGSGDIPCPLSEVEIVNHDSGRRCSATMGYADADCPRYPSPMAGNMRPP